MDLARGGEQAVGEAAAAAAAVEAVEAEGEAVREAGELGLAGAAGLVAGFADEVGEVLRGLVVGEQGVEVGWVAHAGEVEDPDVTGLEEADFLPAGGVVAARDEDVEAAEVLVHEGGAGFGVVAPVVDGVLDDGAVLGGVWLFFFGRLPVAARVGLVVDVVHDEGVELLGVLLGAAAEDVLVRLLSAVDTFGVDEVDVLLGNVSRKNNAGLWVDDRP